MDLRYLQRTAWEMAKSKGFHEDLEALSLRDATLIRLALVFTEVAEATQIVKRQGVERPDALDEQVLRSHLGEELADVLIRVGDLAEGLGIDLGEAVEKKLAVNQVRPQNYGTPWEEKQ